MRNLSLYRYCVDGSFVSSIGLSLGLVGVSLSLVRGTVTLGLALNRN